MPVIKASQNDVVILDSIFYIYYPILFKKSKIQVQALINFNNKVNAMIPGYVSKLGPKIRFTNVKTQKIDGSTFKTFELVLASFQVEDKFERPWFFEKTFLLANLYIEIVLKMLFLTLSNANIKFP